MATYTGALLGKRKSDLVDIANALSLQASESDTRADLAKSIQAHLDANKAGLSSDPTFKGLYKKRVSHGRNGNDSSHTPERSSTPPSMEMKHSIDTGAKETRSSINKALERVQDAVDAANVPLPESPLTIEKVNKVVRSARKSVSNALVPATREANDLSAATNNFSYKLSRFGHESHDSLASGHRQLREALSSSQTIISLALAVELLSLFGHVLQFYNYTYYFPPPAGPSGSLADLTHNLYFWVPTFTWTVRLPELGGLVSGELWGAVAWWAFSTVLPPYVLSTLISFVHPKSSLSSSNSDESTPTADTLVFTVIRLAILVLPLTSAAPTALVDALEASGNLQARAWGASLLAALVLAERIA